MTILTQFYLLQYKNWKLQFRKKLVTAIEILIPIILCLLMVSIRTLVDVKEFTKPTYFPSYAIDKLPKFLVDDFKHNVTPNATILLMYTPQTIYTTMTMNQVATKLSTSDCNVIRKYCFPF